MGFAMGREENVLVFQDTERLAKTNRDISDFIKNSTANQRLILEEEAVEAGPDCAKEAKIIISRKRTFEAAQSYKGLKTCVHNFASATTPGGGVVKGSSAQEECLCRCSSLYFSLNTPEMWAGFYTPHREAQDPVHNDDIIYTPEVCVFKTDTISPELMPREDWYNVNVITCAAPNLRQMPSNKMNTGDGFKKVKMLDEDLRTLHEKRLTKILEVASAEGNEVVILGAFGCGAFENNPKVVAEAYKNVLKNFVKKFNVIELAIYCPPQDDTNYRAFANELKEFL